MVREQALDFRVRWAMVLTGDQTLTGERSPMANTALVRMWQQHRLALVGFLIALLVTLAFAARLIVSAVYWSAHREEPIAPWMTVGYVGHSWGVDPRDIDKAAHLPPPRHGHPYTLAEIAKQRGVPTSVIVDLVEQTVEDLRARGGR